MVVVPTALADNNCGFSSCTISTNTGSFDPSTITKDNGDTVCAAISAAQTGANTAATTQGNTSNDNSASSTGGDGGKGGKGGSGGTVDNWSSSSADTCTKQSGGCTASANGGSS